MLADEFWNSAILGYYYGLTGTLAYAALGGLRANLKTDVAPMAVVLVMLFGNGHKYERLLYLCVAVLTIGALACVIGARPKARSVPGWSIWADRRSKMLKVCQTKPDN